MSLLASNVAPSLEALLIPAIEAGQSGRPPSDEQTAGIAASAGRVLEIAPQLIYEQLTRAFMSRHPDVAMQWLRDAGLLIHLLPELDATVSFSQEAGRRHKDVWEHTKLVTCQAVPRPEVRWGAVLHDIGKVPTRKFLEDGRVTFHGHAEVGVRMFRRGPARRIAFPEGVRERVEDLIRHHLRPGQYDGSWTDSAVRRFARELGPILPDLFALSRADVTSKRVGKRRHCLEMIASLRKRIDELEREDTRPKVLPPGLGNLLMLGLHLPPGRHLAVLRERLEQLAREGVIESARDADYYLGVVRERDLLAGIPIIAPGGARADTSRPSG